MGVHASLSKLGILDDVPGLLWGLPFKDDTHQAADAHADIASTLDHDQFQEVKDMGVRKAHMLPLVPRAVDMSIVELPIQVQGDLFVFQLLLAGRAADV